MLRLAVLVLTVLFAAAAAANEAVIRRALEPKMSGAKIEGVSPTAIPGLWEVRFRGAEGVRIVYADSAGNFVLQGSLIDLRNSRNVTEERLRKLNTIAFDKLPLDLAVKVQRGNGKRVLVMFSDPYCPYCKQFEQTLQKVDGITIYVFMYPVIRPELAEQSKSVWCASDRATAWLDLALRAKPPAAATCDNPVEKTLQLGRSLGVNSTPTLFLANGERVSGGLPADDLKEMLDQVAAAPAKR